jgi:hypothetical protein
MAEAECPPYWSGSRGQGEELGLGPLWHQLIIGSPSMRSGPCEGGPPGDRVECSRSGSPALSIDSSGGDPFGEKASEPLVFLDHGSAGWEPATVLHLPLAPLWITLGALLFDWFWFAAIPLLALSGLALRRWRQRRLARAAAVADDEPEPEP